MYFNQLEFGKRIKELRNRKGVTQEEMAEDLNISYVHINKIEGGKRGCSVDLIMELSSYFSVSTDYLLTGIDYYTEPKKRIEDVMNELASIIQIMH